jgi:filamin
MKFHVDSISSGYVTAYGAGLTHGATGEPTLFTISTKGAGAGGLSMAVEGPSKAEVRKLIPKLIKIFNENPLSDQL